jgi:hypothetical protein
MKTITIRNTPPTLAKAIRQRAREAGVSYGRTVLDLVAEALGVPSAKTSRRPHADLDQLIGTWSTERSMEFDAALREQRRLDGKVDR